MVSPSQFIDARTPDARTPDALTPEARSWLEQAREQVASDAAKNLPVLFPQLPRRIGRNPFATGEHAQDGIRVDLGAWRACDAAALLLIETLSLDNPEATEPLLLDLYYHGDMEEKAMVFRTMACGPVRHATITLLGEAQRTNTSNHFEAAICDSNLLCRAVDHEGFGLEGFNRMILKLAFVDLPLDRVLDAESRANGELSRMLQDLATEREAAGRRVWRDTNLLIAQAPTAGTLARLAGGLEHGDDAHRLAAARGLAYVKHDALLAFARERLDREPVAAIRDALQRALS